MLTKSTGHERGTRLRRVRPPCVIVMKRTILCCVACDAVPLQALPTPTRQQPRGYGVYGGVSNQISVRQLSS
jgi:hypothetical protein